MQTEILGRRPHDDTDADAPTGRIGHHRARDGSRGAPVAIDLDRPHAGLVVGKRGYGKSYTLGVLAEEAARTHGLAPVVVDPMGVFRGLAREADGNPVPATIVGTPTIRTDTIPPDQWPRLVGTDPDRPVGALVWHAASAAETLSGMRTAVSEADVDAAVRRAAENRLRRADAWGVFDPDGLDAATLGSPEATVLDCADLDDAPANAVVAGVAAALYDGRVGGASALSEAASAHATIDRLPWLFVDEAHVFFEGVAGASLRTLLTRGRSPGVSLVTATQRPSALPDVAVSQSDLRIVHRLTAGPDVRTLAAADPSYLTDDVTDAMPTAPGEALVVDDTAEAVRTVAIRERDTPPRRVEPAGLVGIGDTDGSVRFRGETDERVTLGGEIHGRSRVTYGRPCHPRSMADRLVPVVIALGGFVGSVFRHLVATTVGTPGGTRSPTSSAASCSQ